MRSRYYYGRGVNKFIQELVQSETSGKSLIDIIVYKRRE